MRLLPIIPLAFCTSRALTQNSTSSNNTTCEETFGIESPLNASALVEVPSSGTPPWYLGVAFGDDRGWSRMGHSVAGFLSMPANSTAHVCVQVFNKILPATGTGANGDCAGVLSEGCIDFLHRTFALTQLGVHNKQCPSVSGVERLEKACPPLADLYHSYRDNSTGPLSASDTSCPSSRIPGPEQPPSGYDNSQLLDIYNFLLGESDMSALKKYTWYDRYIEQPMLWVVSAFEEGESRTSLVCVRPERVEEGSRVPSESDAERLGVRWSFIAVVAAVLMAV